MIIIQGKGVYKGVAIGKLSFLNKKQQLVKRIHIDDHELEIDRFHKARELSINQLQQLYEKAVDDVGESNAAIFEIHQMMLEDQDYIDSVENIIQTQMINAEFAVATTAGNFYSMFQAMDDEYMRARAIDVKDVSERVISVLAGDVSEEREFNEPVIIAADDLAPSETIQMDKSNVIGFATKYGSTNSHTAILARTLNIPAIIGLDEQLIEEFDDALVILDGETGLLYVDPDNDTLCEMQSKMQEEHKRKHLLETLKGKENITKSGRKINVFANIGNLGDVGLVLNNDAGGIGLFRSEFLYLAGNDFPSEEEQFAAYKAVAENMAGKKVIIRTLDIGADKKVDYFNLEEEENPALGYRAIRICLTQPEIFKTQLRAIYRASAYGNISIMFPMIISINEVKQIKEICRQVRDELDAAGINYKKDMEHGVMIETPAAALISSELAKEVDFFSVGTNDLTQYTLAIDRQNMKLDGFCDTHHPAILSLIKLAADNAHAEGKWIGICGELAADLTLTEEFIKMGIDELSVSSGKVLEVREKIRSCM